MKEKLDKIEDKLDKIEERLDRIDLILERNTGSLEKHMLRTELSEARIEHMEEALKPIVKHVNMLEGVLKFFGAVSVVIATVAGFLKILEFF